MKRINLIMLNIKNIVVIMFFIMIVIFNIEGQEIKECIIKDYDISVFKTLTRITKIKYDSKVRVIEEKYYQGFFGVPFHSILKYEYPDDLIKVQYVFSKHWSTRKNVTVYDKNKNIVKMIAYDIKDEVTSLSKWEKNYNQYEYIQIIEHEFEYNEHNDLVLAKSLQGKFVDMPGPLKDLPNDGLNGKYEEFKYEYNDKGQKIKVFGKFQKTASYYKEAGNAYGEWRYFYDDEGNLIKLEKHGLKGLYSYTEYKYLNKKLITEFFWSGDYKDGKRLGYEIAGYASYEYYDDGRLKRVNHHDTEFKKIEDMKVWSYEEYEYK